MMILKFVQKIDTRDKKLKVQEIREGLYINLTNLHKFINFLNFAKTERCQQLILETLDLD